LPPHLEVTEWGFNDNAVFDVITDEGATLGRVLFYDQLLSANNNLSCATCHSQHLSFADDSPFSEGVSSETDVNSMHLNDLGWTNRSGFFWDLSQHDLADMIDLPLTNPNEIGLTDIQDLVIKMEQTTYYPELFEKAYGSTMITKDRIQTAIMEFLSSMTTFNTRFDQAKRGELELTDLEQMGEALFLEHCSICHTHGSSFLLGPGGGDPMDSPLFVTPSLFANGLPLEQGDIGAGQWNPEFSGLFKAPTLRNIEKTRPYMHDGRFETLEDVVEHYSSGLEPTVEEWGGILPSGGLNFNWLEKQALVDFMKTLTDESFLSDVRFSDPFDNPVNENEPVAAFYDMQVFPNPTSDVLSISFDNPNRQLVDVYLLSIDGKVVRKMSTHLDGLSTDVSQLTKGTYLVRAMQDDIDWLEEKFVVQ